MNHCAFIGRATKEPEVRYTTGQNPLAVAKFTIAVDSGYGDKKRTAFVPVTCFRSTAEYVSKYLKKGRLVAVEGEYATGKYEKEDGTTVFTTNINANQVSVLEYEKKTGEAEEEGIPEGFQALDDEECPF